MEASIEAVVGLDTSQGVSPRIVKEDFGVHIRTVFRWIKKGELTSLNGRVQDDYRNTSLPNWKKSCSFPEGKEKLKVSYRTMKAWKKKGLLETVRVMGLERALISSVERIMQRQKKRRKRGLFSLHPTHSLPRLILEITGIGRLTLKVALDNGIVPSVPINGVRMVPNEEIERIKKDWTSSCRPVAAQKIIGKGRDVRRWMANGRLPTITVVGQRRIVLKSLAKTPEEEQRLQEYLRLEKQKYKRRVNEGIKGYRKLKKAKNVKKNAQKSEKVKLEKSRESFRAKRIEKVDMLYKTPKRVVAPIPDYKPEQIQVRGFESRRLTTCEEAAKATGKTPTQIKDLFMIGSLRGQVVDDRIFVFLLSLENLIVKLKQGANL